MKLRGLIKVIVIASFIGTTTTYVGCSSNSEESQKESSYADYIYKENLKDVCFSYFTSIVTRNYSEVPWGIQSISENSTVANVDKLDENNNGIVTLSYKFENPPRENSVVSIDFDIKDDNIRVVGIYIDGEFFNPPEETTVFRPISNFIQ